MSMYQYSIQKNLVHLHVKHPSCPSSFRYNDMFHSCAALVAPRFSSSFTVASCSSRLGSSGSSSISSPSSSAENHVKKTATGHGCPASTLKVCHLPYISHCVYDCIYIYVYVYIYICVCVCVCEHYEHATNYDYYV